MEIKTIEAEDFKTIKNQLVELYIEAFSSGISFQYHNAGETLNYLQEIINVGYGIVAFQDKQLVGATLLTPLTFDKLVPAKISSAFDLTRSVYVAEMMVAKNSQGQGTGKKMLQYFLDTVDKNRYEDAFIRVWIENKAALSLYRKTGFEPFTTMVHSKLLADKSGWFDFEKMYLHQELK